MLDIFNRGLLFITNITGYTSGKYSWKSYPVQRNSLATDSMPAGGERPPQKEIKRPEHTKGNLSQQPALFYPKKDYMINTFHFIRRLNPMSWQSISCRIASNKVREAISHQRLGSARKDDNHNKQQHNEEPTHNRNPK